MLLEEKKNKKRTLKIFVDKKVSSCMLYFLKRESNHTLKNSLQVAFSLLLLEAFLTPMSEMNPINCTEIRDARC